MNDNVEFDKWNNKKKQINQGEIKHCKIGEIYFANIGRNIGSEIYGKDDEFKRAVLVINKIFINNYVNLAIIIPLTSKIRNKSGYLHHRFKDSKNKEQVALLAQLRVIDTRRIVSYISKINKSELNIIKDKIRAKII